MATYDEAKARNFTKATTVAVTGIPLGVSEDHPLRRASFEPIQVCVCVTDPCPCDDNSIVWVGDSDVRARVATGRQAEAGEELYEFAVDADAVVVVESLHRTKAADLAGHGRPFASRPAPIPRFLVRPRPDARQSASSETAQRADPGCNDYEITESGAVYCFVESSEHYCIYVLC